MNSLTPEKINQIKQIINELYNEIDIQSQIKDTIAAKLNEQPTVNSNSNKSFNRTSVTQEYILEEIKRKGTVDSLMSDIELNSQNI
jgi:hypothetical protein